MSRSTSFPPREVGRALHARLVVESTAATAASDVCLAYMEPLFAALGRRFRHVDPDACSSAAHDALLAYLAAPHRFDPARGDLGWYLLLVADRDLRNALKKERRHRDRVALFAVELGRSAGNPSADEDAAAAHEFLARSREDLPDDERRVLDLLAEGERSTRAYAAVLGLGDAPAADQTRGVKRAKDRVKKRLQRGGDHGRTA